MKDGGVDTYVITATPRTWQKYKLLVDLLYPTCIARTLWLGFANIVRPCVQTFALKESVFIYTFV